LSFRLSLQERRGCRRALSSQIFCLTTMKITLLLTRSLGLIADLLVKLVCLRRQRTKILDKNWPKLWRFPKTRGALVIRKLCSLLDSAAIYLTLAKILNDKSDLEFTRLMVKTLNLILLTAPELSPLRNVLKLSFAAQERLMDWLIKNLMIWNITTGLKKYPSTSERFGVSMTGVSTCMLILDYRLESGEHYRACLPKLSIIICSINSHTRARKDCLDSFRSE